MGIKSSFDKNNSGASVVSKQLGTSYDVVEVVYNNLDIILKASLAVTTVEDLVLEAEASKDASQASATSAEASKNAAAQSASEAAISVTNAALEVDKAKAEVEIAKGEVVKAQTEVQNAKDEVSKASDFATEAGTQATQAETSKNSAVVAANSASSFSDSAEGYAVSANTNALAAEASKTTAATKASEASDSATIAVASKDDAVTFAGAAQSSAGTAASQAALALNQRLLADTAAATASTQAGIATTKADEASNSQVASALALDTFTDQYLGSKTADPDLDNDGDPLQDGALYWNNLTKRMKVYDLASTTWHNPTYSTGTDPDQIPTNADLGSAATYDVGTGDDNLTLWGTIKAWVYNLFVANVDSISDLPTTVVAGRKVNVTGYHPNTTVGGGTVVGVASARHNGITNFDTSRSAEIGTEPYYFDSGVDVPCYQRTDVNIDRISAEIAGAMNGATLPLAIHAAIDLLPTNGGTITFSGDYSGISEDIKILRNKVVIEGTGANRMIFNAPYGLRVGYADFAAPNKNTSTKVVTIKLKDFHVTGETNYTGTLTHFEFADQITTENFNSSPISISSASGSLCVGLKVSWVQWWWDYSGVFGGNKWALWFNFTNHGIDNEDHFHLNGTRIYLQKGLITGVVCAAVYAFFENGRNNGAAEVSFDGVHLGEFADGGSDLTNAYCMITQLDGNVSDKKIFRSVSFNDCMIEQFKTMFDLKTLNTGAGKDTSIYVFNGSYFVGNNFATDVLFRAETFKAFSVFRDCESSSIDTLFEGVQCKFEGRNDFSPYNTFSNLGYGSHDFVGARPVVQFRTRKTTTGTLSSGLTALTIAHGLVAAPTRVEVELTYDSTWYLSYADETNVQIFFGTAPVGDKQVKVHAAIESTQ